MSSQHKPTRNIFSALLGRIVVDKNCFLRRCYKQYLSKLKGAEYCKRLVVRVINIVLQQHYQLVELPRHPSFEMIAPSIEIVPPRRVYGIKSFHPENTEVTYISPGLFVRELQNVIVLGGSDFIFRDNFLFHPDSYDCHTHICSMEQHGFARIIPSNKTAKVARMIPISTIKKGISLLGDYAHFMTEIIPKMLASESLYQKVSI